MHVIIMTPALALHDAIGNDVIKQRKCLLERGVTCEVYAEFYRSELFDFDIISEDYLVHSVKTKKVILLYHHALFWAKGEKLLASMRSPVVVKYHNITPPSFYEEYDKCSFHGTTAGREQTKRLIQEDYIVSFMGASEYNCRELHSLGVPRAKLSAVEPYNFLEDFDQGGENKALAKSLKATKVNLLFVGRVVPNKGFKHLIHIVDRYVEHYGTDVCLNIIGGMTMEEKSYYKELELLINEKRLGKFIAFRNKLSFEDLCTYYRHSSFFLLCSEHEGFCVPVLEAQYFNLPIIALDRAAVKDTLGPEQVIFEDLNYDLFAAAIYQLSKDKSMRDYLACRGQDNVAKYTEAILSQKTFEILDRSVKEAF